MERILLNSTASITETWYEDGDPVDPAVVTVDIDRDDGTSIVSGGSTTGSGAGARSYVLSSTQTALLDRLTVTWTSSTLGIRTAYVEVCGGFFFSLAEARALDPLQNVSKYPAANLAVARTLAESAIEDACEVAFVPRYRRDSLSGTGGGSLILPTGMLSALRALKQDGLAIATSDVKVRKSGLLYRPSGWVWGVDNFEASYEHGYAVMPARVGRAGLLLAKQWLVKGPLDDRATSLSTDDGTFSLLTPGVRGMLFGIPEVEAVVQQYRQSLKVR